MSSQELEDSNNDSEFLHADDSESPLPEKKRRVRACDMCRRRKVRCDGGRMAGNQCSNCIAFKYTCTYAQASKKRFTDPEYVQNLETQLARTQELLHKLSSRLELVDPSGMAAEKSRWPPVGQQTPDSESENSSTRCSRTPGPRLPNMSFDPKDEDLDPSDDEMTLRQNIELSIKHLSLESSHPQFLGKSSGLMFLQTALDMKEEYVGGKLPHAAKLPLAGARPQFWSELPWTVMPEYPYPFQTFPDQAFMQQLVDLYFVNFNIYMPLLHRPTFEKEIREGRHLVDEGFGATVLLTCALGAKFSDDPRALLEVGGPQSSHSAGWKWFHPVQAARKAIRLQHRQLYDLQIACLVAMFLHGSSTPQTSFSIIGEAIRVAQDLGAHRRKVYATMPLAEGELLKRAFWVLVCLDRSLSSALGRACCIQDEDFDLDLPIECDDEYWYNDDPKLAFKQPPGKPSLLAFFNSLIRLNKIHSCVLRTIYAINKSKTLLGFSGPDWEQHIVTELDSSLNKWVDTVPDHLKWDPHMENITFLNQSAFIYTTYYFLQITIHRPYIPSPRKPSLLAFPSLAICTNAARSCVHVLDVQYNRCSSSTYQNMMGLFCAGVVLLLNIWSGKRSGSQVNMTREMNDVHKVMIMLKALEPRWHTAGRVLDVMCELATVGEVPLPQTQSGGGTLPLKRGRDASSSELPTSPSSTTSSSSQDSRRQIAGSKRVHMQSQRTSPPAFSPRASMSTPPSTSSFNLNNVSLPMHSDELGRFPLHPAFNCPTQELPRPNGWNSAGTGVNTAVTMQSSSGNPSSGVESMFVPNFIPTLNSYQSAASPTSPIRYPAASTSPQMNAAADMGATPSESSWAAFPDLLDSETMTMWSTAPSGMEWEDWGKYITNMSGMGNTTDTPGPSDSIY